MCWYIDKTGFQTLFALYFIIIGSQLCQCKGVYDNLLKDLFDGYNPGVRPVLELKQSINVGIAFGIIQLLDVVSFNIFPINISSCERFSV